MKSGSGKRNVTSQVVMGTEEVPVVVFDTRKASLAKMEVSICDYCQTWVFHWCSCKAVAFADRTRATNPFSCMRT